MLEQIKEELSLSQTTLVAVSKTKPQSAILEMYKKGQRIFGENRVPELVQKYENLPKDIQWHMIGKLQRNKVKHIVPFVKLIHSIDNIKLIFEIEKNAAKLNKNINGLLQFKIADENTKSGFEFDEALQFLKSNEFKKLNHLKFTGVMGMATFTSDENKVEEEFKTMFNYFSTLKEEIFFNNDKFKEISMGMSGDYKLAIKQGSTIVRIGSLLFGNP